MIDSNHPISNKRDWNNKKIVCLFVLKNQKMLLHHTYFILQEQPENNLMAGIFFSDMV